MQRNIVDNEAVVAAFDKLAVELEFARITEGLS